MWKSKRTWLAAVLVATVVPLSMLFWPESSPASIVITPPPQGVLTDPSVSIGDSAIVEGDQGRRSAYVTIVLSNPAEEQMTVGFVTLPDTATEEDFRAKLLTITFKPGQTQKSVTVPILGDTTVEPMESLVVTLFDPSPGLNVFRRDGLVTIVSDD